jgi:hypothetical protein
MTIKPVLVPDHDAVSLRKLMDHFATASTGPTKKQLNESRSAVTAAQGITEARNTYTVVFVDPSDAPKQIGTFDNAAEAKQLIRNSYREMYDTGDHLRNVAPGIYVLEEDYRNTGEQATADNYKHMYHWIIQKSSAVSEGSDDSGAYDKWDPKHPDFVKNYKKFQAKNPGATLKDFIADLKKGVTESSGAQVDMKGKKCTACKKGTYQETGQHDDMDGVLHCDKCRKQVKRHQSAASKKKNVSESLNEFLAPDGSNYGGDGGGDDEPRQYRVIITLYDDSAHEDETAERRIGITVTATSEQAACDQAETMLLKSDRYDGSRITNVTARPVLDEQTMSRAAKGYEKYGREGMQALAKAGREGRALDPVRDRYDRYDEAVVEGSDGKELKAIDGDYYEDSTDFFSMFEQDHFDREEESDDGMEIRGYIDDHCVMVFKYSTPDMMGGWGNYDDSALMAESGVEDEEGETCPECDGAGCPECYGEEDRDRAHDHAQGMERESAGMAEGAGGSSPTKVMKKYLPRSMWDPILSHTGKSKHSNADGSKTSHVWRLRNLVRSFQGREFDAWKQAVEQELGSGYKVTSEWPTPSVRYIQMNQAHTQTDVTETADVKYGVFAKGGSVGSQRFRDDPLKTFDTKEEAIADARRRRSGLSKGERGYYRMGYVVKPIKGDVDEGWKQIAGAGALAAATALGGYAAGSNNSSSGFSNTKGIDQFNKPTTAQVQPLRTQADLDAYNKTRPSGTSKLLNLPRDFEEGIAEDDVDDFVAGGGKITQVKPNPGPRRSGVSLGSKHIGTVHGGKASSISGKRANTRPTIKPVVAVEQQVDEIDMGLVGDAVAGAAMGLGSVGLGSYIGHKIGNKIGQKFIDRSNRKEAERQAKYDREEWRSHRSEIDEKSEAVRHGNNSRSIYHVDESVDPIEQLRADIRRFAQ